MIWRGFVCVMQETLTMPIEGEIQKIWKNPAYDWVGSIDGSQVGYDRHGQLKAYDFVHP
jgi:hypothetical protein